MMDPTTTAYGTWSGGRFMHFGETLTEERFIGLHPDRLSRRASAPLSPRMSMAMARRMNC